MSKKVFVGMSGGVDSSVSALLLQRAGFDVVGVYMKCWEGLPTKTGLKFSESCDWEAERRDALRVAVTLGIPFRTYDFVQQYRDNVVEYFFNEYKHGRTPNPDVMCNREIKFNLFLERAKKEGADYIATGHYARRTDESQLSIPKDKEKDQTYFLWTLTKDILNNSLFPLGELTKREVREIAREAKLPVAEKKDSQGICFIGQVPVHDFIAERLPSKVGNVLSPDGEVLGTHLGAHFYTVGQRHGMELKTTLPHYVVSTDVDKNIVYVVPGNADERLYRTELVAEQVSWVNGQLPTLPLQARIRYRQPLQEIFEIVEMPDRRVLVKFAEPQRAVTSGQSLVMYCDGVMVGGGIIA